jgi:hypothetical protein
LEPNDELAGDVGAAFALCVNVGTAISTAKARAAISVFMTRLHYSDFRPLIASAAAADRPAPARQKWLRRRPGAVMPITSSGQFRVIKRD